MDWTEVFLKWLMWLAGTAVLSFPLLIMCGDLKVSIPFCIAWAFMWGIFVQEEL